MADDKKATSITSFKIVSAIDGKLVAALKGTGELVMHDADAFRAHVGNLVRGLAAHTDEAILDEAVKLRPVRELLQRVEGAFNPHDRLESYALRNNIRALLGFDPLDDEPGEAAAGDNAKPA